MERLALGPKEAAASIGVSETTLRRWMVEEHLPYARIRGRILIRVDKLLAWLDEREERPGIEVADIVSLVEAVRGE